VCKEKQQIRTQKVGILVVKNRHKMSIKFIDTASYCAKLAKKGIKPNENGSFFCAKIVLNKTKLSAN